MGVEWLNRYVALEREDSYGVEPGEITGIAIGANGTGSGTNGTYNWRAGTKASPTGGGFGAFGTIKIAGAVISEIKVTEGGQGYTSAPTLFQGNGITALNASGGATNGLSGTVTLNVTLSANSNGVTYGEVDDESMKQTFELLTRNDMSRQVASKAVTNTQYGEGSINLAVQPDDFMGKVLHSFLPYTEEGNGFIDNIAVSGTNNDYTGTDTSVALVFTTIIFTVTGSSYNDDPTITHASSDKIATGQGVSGDGIPSGAQVGVVTDATHFELVDALGAALSTTGGSLSSKTLTFDTNPLGEIAEAVADINTSTNAITKIYITNPGKGYKVTSTSKPTVSASFGGGSNATLTVNMGTARTHIFNEPELSTHAYPSYTMRVGRGEKEHTFKGMVASKLSMSANLNEYVMASVDFIGQAEGVPTTLVAGVDYAGLAVDALHFADAEVYFEDNANKTIKVQQISFEININRDIDSAYAVGNRTFTRAPPTQTREISGTMEFNEVLYSDTVGYVNEPTYTSLTGSQVHKIQPGGGKDAIRIKFASEDGNDSLEFKFFNVRFEAPTASVSGRDANRMSVGFQAFYDATTLGAGKAIEAKLIGSGSHVQNTTYNA